MGSGEVPFVVRLLGKFVLEVLPAALASVIGAFLFAHYQFDRSAGAPAVAPPPMAVVPASTQMLALVREEHAMIRDYLIARRAAEERRADADDAADVRVAADARMPATPVRRATMAVLRSAEARKPVNIVAAPAAEPAAVVTLPPAATALPPVVVAGVAPDAGPMPPAPIGPPAQASQQSLVDRTLALPGHVVAVTLHAVMAIGGIPSWIGHRFGAANLDSG